MSHYEILDDVGDIFHFGADVATSAGEHLVARELAGVVQSLLANDLGLEVPADPSDHPGTSPPPVPDPHGPAVVDSNLHGNTFAATENARQVSSTGTHDSGPTTEPPDPHAPPVVNPDPYGHGSGSEKQDVSNNAGSQGVVIKGTHYTIEVPGPLDPHGPSVTWPGPHDAAFPALSDHAIL